MKIVKILGGLGNQMFQYALYLSIKEEFYSESVKVDCSYFNGYNIHGKYNISQIFDINLPQASFKELLSVTWPLFHYRLWQIGKILLPTKNTQCFEKANFEFDNTIMLQMGDRYFDGYWQNECYFKKHELLVRKAYQFKNKLDKWNLEMLNTIRYTNNSVSIHIRRCDYLKIKLYKDICGIDYYINAITYIKKNLTNPTFFVFSDDIIWCKENLNDLLTNNSAIYIDWNKNINDYKDMQLMCSCQHNIIANSSFSWWGAWLNENSQKIVIAPQKWLNIDLKNSPQLNDWILM
jgi:hypothetical protein